MKSILLIFSTFFFIQCYAQEPLSAIQWQEDLRFLQRTVHQDYPFLFVKTTEEIFDAEVETLHANIPNLQEHEIVLGISKIIALFKYGHMGVGVHQTPYDFHQLPLNLYEFSDGVYIQGVHRDYPKALGAKVLEINKVPIAQALKQIYPVVSAENSQYFKAAGIPKLTVPEVLHAQGITAQLEHSIEFTLKKNGEIFRQRFTTLAKGEKVPTDYGYISNGKNWLEARNQEDRPLYLKHLDRVYFFEYLKDEKAVYVRHSQIENDPEEDTQSFYTRVFDFIENNEVEKLILDVRLNGGGNSYLNKPIVTGIIETEKINTVGSLFVIIGRNTFSACQNLVNDLESFTNAIFVGEPTAENINFYGDNRLVPLPNSKLPVYLSYAWWQKKPAWENAEWLAPSLPVEMSFGDYTANRDTALDTALTFSDADFKPNPMRYITDLFVRGKMEELNTAVPKMIQDPKYAFFDFESELTKTGWHLTKSGRPEGIQAGIGVLSMVSQLFPQSPKVWQTLAQAHLKAGDTNRTIELLEKVISMDKQGTWGQDALELLDVIKNN